MTSALLGNGAGGAVNFLATLFVLLYVRNRNDEYNSTYHHYRLTDGTVVLY